MNIFTLSEDLIECALWLDDKRLVKMILETAQILSTAAHRNSKWESWMYRPTHRNHPCCVWAGQSDINSIWLTNLGLAYCSEYTYRYGKVHKSEELLNRFYRDELCLTPVDFPNCTPYKDMYVIPAYRKYMCDKWNNSPGRWTKRDKPNWYT